MGNLVGGRPQEDEMWAGWIRERMGNAMGQQQGKQALGRRARCLWMVVGLAC